MKKMIVILFLCLGYSVFAGDVIGIKWNVGNSGLKFNASFDNSKYNDYFIELINIGFEHTPTRIGMEINPLKFWWFSDTYTESPYEKALSLINANLYWNIVDLGFFDGDARMRLGPVASVNYLYFMDMNTFKSDEYQFSAGVRLAFSLDFSKKRKINYHLLGCEVGYRRTNHNDGFYLTLNADLILTTIVFLVVSLSND